MGARLDNWRNQMEAYLTYTAVPDDHRIVRFAAAYLSGPPSTWWRALPAAEKATLVNWETFMAKMYRRFRPVQSAKLARHQLTSLRQGPKQSAHAYSHVFLTALSPLDESPTDQLHHFITCLRPIIAGKVWERNPTDLETAMDAAVSVHVETMLSLGRSAALILPSAANHRPYYPTFSAPAGDDKDINNFSEHKFDEDANHAEQTDPVALLLNRMESIIDKCPTARAPTACRERSNLHPAGTTEI
jgi:hypothetical protein